MGAMPPVPQDKRYVMIVEIPGLKTAEDAEKVNKIVKDLKDRFGASVKFSIVGEKEGR